ncbi:hypothetical protein G3I60_28420 [Streptomyces sp. SID13666]|uniref:hypothetical protein n=1 Tax=unclassified Streptomyces TaxID=2593676 RepID=UPI0013C09E9E|nr:MULTISPECIES: hypothetical protein [unclassified Streptomyces]NEA57979.1 hypothetical protein [Streptomyces sp. SID13666]NEA72837.1 hypothetical protein [Streptomyces sp. SID13588]
MNKRKWTARSYTLTPIVRWDRASGWRMSVRDARACLNGGRRIAGADVFIYATTDRQGTPLHIGYVRIPASTYSGFPGGEPFDPTAVYEIPTAALTDI